MEVIEVSVIGSCVSLYHDVKLFKLLLLLKLINFLRGNLNSDEFELCGCEDVCQSYKYLDFLCSPI